MMRKYGDPLLSPSPSLQVWGSDAEGAIHNPPTDIVWRSQGTWGSGSNVITKLVNKAGEVRFIWDGTYIVLS